MAKRTCIGEWGVQMCFVSDFRELFSLLFLFTRLYVLRSASGSLAQQILLFITLLLIVMHRFEISLLNNAIHILIIQSRSSLHALICSIATYFRLFFSFSRLKEFDANANWEKFNEKRYYEYELQIMPSEYFNKRLSLNLHSFLLLVSRKLSRGINGNTQFLISIGENRICSSVYVANSKITYTKSTKSFPARMQVLFI